MTYKGMLTEQKELLMFYGLKLGFEKDEITDLWYSSIDQFLDILKTYVEPYAEEWDREEVKLDKSTGKVIFPNTFIEAYKKIVSDPKGFRLNESYIPEEYGGAGLPDLPGSALGELFCYYDSALCITTVLAKTVIEAISLFPTPYLTQTYFPRLKEGTPGFVAFTEPQAGSNLKNIKTTAKEEGDYFIVKGNKIFITNGGFGEIGLLLARDGERGTSTFVVDTSMKNADDSSRPGIFVSRIEEKMGLRASPTSALDINVVIPKENLLGQRGRGYQTVLERLMGMRVSASIQGCGVAERAYTLAKQYAQDRVQFDKPISSFPGVANKLKGMENNLSWMRKLSYEASYALNKVHLGQKIKTKYLSTTSEEEHFFGEVSDHYKSAIVNLAISKAKMFNTEVGWMIIDDALQIHGGNGYVREYKVEKLLRDFRISRIFEGTSEIQEHIVNKAKSVGHASDLRELKNSLMMKQEVGPIFSALNYSDLFLKRFPSVMDAFLDIKGEPTFLFDN